MRGGCKWLWFVLAFVEGDVDLSELVLQGEFSFSDGEWISSSLGPIGDNWLDNLLELFKDGWVRDGRFDRRGVCRSQLSTICVGSVSW